jgi:hypothetical protein
MVEVQVDRLLVVGRGVTVVHRGDVGADGSQHDHDRDHREDPERGSATSSAVRGTLSG